MRMYLSSFRLGDHPERLVELVAMPRRTLVIANAVDAYGDEDRRREGVEREMRELGSLGLDPSELDLREYFDDRDRLRKDLATSQLLWVRGGNAFVLRYLFARTGLDELVRQGVRDEAFVYSGYSAGVVVLQRTLRGLELVDDPEAVRRSYGAEPLWDGLGLIDHAVVPHYESPENPETEACGRLADSYRDAGIPHITLRDGQAIIVDGASRQVI